MVSPSHNLQERILVLAPFGGDADNTVSLLAQHKITAEAVRDILHLCQETEQGVGALLIAEEALFLSQMPCLIQVLAKQPSWSDIPLIIITSGGDTTQASLRAYGAFGSRGNITLLERPFRFITLLSSLEVALRSRRRQYEVRTLMDTLEERVAERTARLEETISELEAFSYSVSHDLRAPLRAMQGYSYFLLEDYKDKLDADGREYINRIISASNRLDRLVQDILTYSRFSRCDLEIHVIDLKQLVEEVIQHYPSLRPPQARIHLPDTLHSVLGHEGSLVQCMSNLLSNAVKFMPPGRTPQVTLSSEWIDGQIRLSIQDNGIGIAPSHQSRIFKMFERAPHEKNYDGTGIGLAIVQKAVERMGGKIGVESALGEGSRFWIQLPAAPSTPSSISTPKLKPVLVAVPGAAF